MNSKRSLAVATLAFLIFPSGLVLAGDDYGSDDGMYDNGSMNRSDQKSPPSQTMNPSSPDQPSKSPPPGTQNQGASPSPDGGSGSPGSSGGGGNEGGYGGSSGSGY
jgi:hypothetical protein